MGKKSGLFLLLCGSLAYTVYYLAKHNEFSKNTVENYDDFLSSAKKVGNDIERTYISIRDKEDWKKSTKNLSKSAIDFAKDTGDLVVNASSDMYNFFSNKYDNIQKEKKSENVKKEKTKPNKPEKTKQTVMQKIKNKKEKNKKK